MNEPIIINLKDYTPVEIDTDRLKEIYPLLEYGADEGTLIRNFCYELQEQVNNAKITDLYLLEGQSETDHKSELFRLFHGEIYTGGYCGIVQATINDRSVTVNFNSRFDDGKSYFLTHVFEKVFLINARIFKDMKIEGAKDCA